MFLQRYQVSFAQLPQDPIDMDGAEWKRVGKAILIERTIEFIR